MKDNTLSVNSGIIVLNGSPVNCVTKFGYSCIGGGIGHVEMEFDISTKNASFDNSESVTAENVPPVIRIPVLIGEEQVDEIVFEQISHMDGRLSRKELLELALPTLDRNIKSAASGDINYKCLEQFLRQRKQIKEELKFLTGKED